MWGPSVLLIALYMLLLQTLLCDSAVLGECHPFLLHITFLAGILSSPLTKMNLQRTYLAM